MPPAPSLSLTSASGTILNDDNLRVSIAASQGTALEERGSAPGVFTVSRNGNDGQVAVSLELAPTSTAAYPADFSLSNVAAGSGVFTATIPEGSSSVAISLFPVDDLAAEASEFASLRLRTSPDYDIAGGGAASVTIPANDVAATSLEDFDPALAPNGGEGTLRQALLNANSFPGSNAIVFAPGVSGTLFLTSGELLVTSDLSIIGPGAEPADDLGRPRSERRVQLREIPASSGWMMGILIPSLMSPCHGLKIVGGLAAGDAYPENAGGGILNRGESLSVREVTVSQNTANFGAGIENTGELFVFRSTISRNDATELGGGIDNFGATLDISESTISENSAGFGGGGVENSGSANIYGSTLARNFAVKVAGAVDNYGGDLVIANSTISENESPIGGGIVHEDGLMTIVNCTVVQNVAKPSLNANVGGGIFVTDSATTTVNLDNSIVAGNTRIFNGATIPSDLGGKAVSNPSRNNLIGDANSAGGLANRTNGNLTGIEGAGPARSRRSSRPWETMAGRRRRTRSPRIAQPSTPGTIPSRLTTIRPRSTSINVAPDFRASPLERWTSVPTSAISAKFASPTLPSAPALEPRSLGAQKLARITKCSVAST